MTSKEFAKLIGVSQSTVSRALNNSDLVPEQKKAFILQKAREYGFELNSQAKSLRTKKTATIGILLPKHFKGMSTNLMHAYVYDKLQKELSQYAYDIMVIYYDDARDDFSSFERIIRSGKVDGFLVLRMELSDLEVELLQKYKVPCVFTMNAGSKIRDNLNYIFADSVHGGYLAGQYLGKFPEYHKMFITVHEERSDAKRRMEGYIRGLESAGCELREEDILYCNLSVESAYECAAKNIDKFLNRKVALFAYCDMLAIGMTQALKEHGVVIPEQVQVIGMDDIPLSSILHPSITTLHVQLEEMIPKACSLLMDLIDKKELLVQEWIKPRMILRETTIN